MYVSRRTLLATLTAAALAGSAATAVTALAHQAGHDRGRGHGQDRNRVALFTSLAPSVPSDPALLGAAAGGVPWVIRSSEATLRNDGRLTVRIRYRGPWEGNQRDLRPGMAAALLTGW